MDEPTSGLDPLGRRLVRDIITQLREEGTAVFLNSHLLSEVELTCDRVAFIREGTIVRSASVEELEQESLEVVVRVGQPTPELLQGLAGFTNGAQPEQVNGRIHLTLTDEEKIPQLVNWLVQQGHTLYELSPQRLSLEDRFLQIIGDKMYDA